MSSIHYVIYAIETTQINIWCSTSGMNDVCWQYVGTSNDALTFVHRRPNKQRRRRRDWTDDATWRSWRLWRRSDPRWLHIDDIAGRTNARQQRRRTDRCDIEPTSISRAKTPACMPVAAMSAVTLASNSIEQQLIDVVKDEILDAAVARRDWMFWEKFPTSSTSLFISKKSAFFHAEPGLDVVLSHG